MIGRGRPLDPSVQTDLLEAVRMVQVVNGYIHVAGVPVCPMPHPASDGSEALVPLETSLYCRWYARWSPPASGSVRDVETPETLGIVRAAHHASERFTTGWTVGWVGAFGDIQVVRDGEELFLQPPDYVNITRLAAPVAVGDSVAVTTRRDSFAPKEGWWYTWSSKGPPPSSPMVRIYFNCAVESIGDFLRAITPVLEEGDTVYMMKCPSEAGLFGRCDSVVLYLSPEIWRSVKHKLRTVYERIAHNLRPEVPRLTKRLGTGVAIAEDPANGGSFGQSRAHAVADGVLKVLRSGLADEDEAIATITARLIAHDISPEHPFLRAGSAEDVVSSW